MFGYIRPCITSLTDAEKTRYRSVYCGICRSLGQRHGSLSRLSVNFDMTYLALMLSSLYEPEENTSFRRCMPHPVRPHAEISGPVIDYAADMTVALAYHKCADDWTDERKLIQKGYGELLKARYLAVKSDWPRQCASIEASLSALSRIENDPSSQPDEALCHAGGLLSELFVWKNDFWEKQLRWFGASLGKFVYLMDAAIDFQQDQKKKLYNPLVRMNVPPEQARELIMQPLGEASEAFEALPLVQDENLMRNILYSGVWQTYNEKMKKQTEGAANGQ